jgi:uncharacterized protein YegL
MPNLIPFSNPKLLPICHSNDGCLADIVLERQPTEVQQLVAIGLDNSPSVYRSGAIHELERRLPEFPKLLRTDAAVRSSLLVAFSLFGVERPWQFAAPFSPVMSLEAPVLSPSSGTSMCTRLIEKVDVLAGQRRVISRVLNVDQRNAWIIDITDGEPTDSHLQKEAQHALRVKALDEGIEVHLFHMGEGPGIEFLRTLEQPRRPSLPLALLDFHKIFRWISESMKYKSRSMPGQVLEIPNITGQLIPTE